MGDFVVVELDVEASRKPNDVVHFVGRVDEIDGEGYHIINFLRSKAYTRDTFYFPDCSDVEKVVRSRVLGVLTLTSTGSTNRQAKMVKVFPPLNNNFTLR